MSNSGRYKKNFKVRGSGRPARGGGQKPSAILEYESPPPYSSLDPYSAVNSPIYPSFNESYGPPCDSELPPYGAGQLSLGNLSSERAASPRRRGPNKLFRQVRRNTGRPIRRKNESESESDAEESGLEFYSNIQEVIKSEDLESLTVSLRLKKCFEDANYVRQQVEKTFQKPDDFEVTFGKIVLLHKTQETLCQLVILSPNAEKAKRIAKSMAFYLQKKFKTKVWASFDQSDENEEGTFDASSNEDEPMALQNPPENESKPKLVKKTKETVPQCLNISVEKRFDSPKLFVEFMQLSLSGISFNYHLIEESVVLTDSLSSCLINIDNEEDASRLKQTFQEIQKHLQIGIYYSAQKPGKNNQEGVEEIKSEVTEALSSIKDVQKESLQIHEEKILFYQDDLKLYAKETSSVKRYTPNSDYILAVQGKITQLQNQKYVFTTFCNSLIQNVQRSDPKKTEGKDVSSLLEAMGRECNRLGRAHSIYAKKEAILRAIKSNKIVYISGQPGSGKSTQLVQYLFDSGYSDNGTIVCCQSRKSAVIGIAERVAREMLDRIGNVVGYKINTNNKADEIKTKILLTTENFLLDDYQKDPYMKKYSCIIIDDVQERGIYTDILLGVIKKILKTRQNIKVILLSNQRDDGTLKKYFKVMQEITVSERLFPVEIIHAEDEIEDYESKAMSLAADICANESSGDILIFLKNSLEIARCCSQFHAEKDFKCLALHEHLPSEEMRKIFEKTPVGVRRIIFASEIAEALVPIEGIKFVIDAGVTRKKKYDPKRNLRISGTSAISKESAIQRKNLAGRNGRGKCYRLYTKEYFNSLAEKNVPEIARENLGNAILKLSWLGINEGSFDFVHSSIETELESALKELEALGAIVDNKMTVIGRWMLKLPYDPPNNYLIYQARKYNLTFEAIVIASLLYFNNDLDVFYTSSTDAKSQDLLTSKKKLNSQLGNAITFFQIYKTWSILSKNEKANWCRQNNVNYETLECIRQSVHETLIILKEDLETVVIKEFSSKANAEDILRKIIFEAYIFSVSHSLDKGTKSYKSLVNQQQLTIHPDSSIVLLDKNPEWIVFTELLQTSREYITGISFADEDWVQEAVESGKIKVDIDEESQELVYHDEVGASVFRCLVGPCFSKLWDMKDEFSRMSRNRCHFEVDKELGAVNIYSNSAMESIIKSRMNTIKMSMLQQLKSEKIELELNMESTPGLKTMKIVVGQGGSVKHFLLPDQSNKILIIKAPNDTTVDDVMTIFETFGQITEVTKFDDPRTWGNIVFGSISEAFAALVGISENDNYTARAVYSSSVPNVFEARISWLNQPIADQSKATIKCSPLDRPILIGCYLDLSGKVAEIDVSPNDKRDLIISNIGSSTEEEITEKISQQLRNHGRTTFDIKVCIVNETDSQTNNLNLDRKKEIVTSFVTNHVKKDEFQIRMPPHFQTKTHNVCFIRFTDPVQGDNLCREMNRRYDIDDQEIEFTSCYMIQVGIPNYVKEANQEQFSEFFSSLSGKHDEMSIEWKQMKRNFRIEIKSSTVEPIAEAIDLLSGQLEGEVVDCSANTDWGSLLLNKRGQEYVKAIQQKTDCIAVTDFRKNKIHFYGSKSKVRLAVEEITSFLATSDDKQLQVLSLQRPDKAPSLMCLAMQKWGPSLDNLVEQCGLKSISIDLINQHIQVVGSTVDLEKVRHCLKELEDYNPEIKMQKENTQIPNCSFCRCPLKTGSIYRLELCEHAYCFDCLKNIAYVGVNNKDLPLTCVYGECRTELVVRDIKFLLSKSFISEIDFITTVVQDFVSNNPEKIKFCQTLNCPMFYSVTDGEMGSEFVCPLCFYSICTNCHRPFHRSMTCHMVSIKSKPDSDQITESASAADQSRKKLMAWLSKK